MVVDFPSAEQTRANFFHCHASISRELLGGPPCLRRAEARPVAALPPLRVLILRRLLVLGQLGDDLAGGHVLLGVEVPGRGR